MKAKIIMVDLDGTLCKGEAWTPKDCLKAKPIQKNIDKVNKLSRGNLVVIWTARNDNLMTATFKWLKENGVCFDAVSNEKPGANIYIDDKMKRFEEV